MAQRMAGKPVSYTLGGDSGEAYQAQTALAPNSGAESTTVVASPLTTSELHLYPTDSPASGAFVMAELGTSTPPHITSAMSASPLHSGAPAVPADLQFPHTASSHPPHQPLHPSTTSTQHYSGGPTWGMPQQLTPQAQERGVPLESTGSNSRHAAAAGARPQYGGSVLEAQQLSQPHTSNMSIEAAGALKAERSLPQASNTGSRGGSRRSSLQDQSWTTWMEHKIKMAKQVLHERMGSAQPTTDTVSCGYPHYVTPATPLTLPLALSDSSCGYHPFFVVPD
jgi:hypothetical protein